MARRSQVIQRELPRPADVNMNILRPYMDTPLTDLQRVCNFLYTNFLYNLFLLIFMDLISLYSTYIYSIPKAEELIKREMITMLHYDALQNPTQSNRKSAASSLAQAQTYLEQHPYDIFEEDELLDVCIKYKIFFISVFLTD